MLRAVWSDFRSYRNGRTWWGTAPVSAAHFLSGIKITVLTFYALTIPSLIRLWELHEGKKVSEMKAWIIQKTELPAIKQTDEKQNLFFRDLGNEVLVFFWQIAAVSCRQQTIQLDLTVERAENIFYFHATDALSSIRKSTVRAARTRRPAGIWLEVFFRVICSAGTALWFGADVWNKTGYLPRQRTGSGEPGTAGLWRELQSYSDVWQQKGSFTDAEWKNESMLWQRKHLRQKQQPTQKQKKQNVMSRNGECCSSSFCMKVYGYVQISSTE